jgi:ABC-type antimicrobial peptide transport system permease subunit
MALLIGLSGAVLPALRATRIPIADALKLAD